MEQSNLTPEVKSQFMQFKLFMEKEFLFEDWSMEIYEDIERKARKYLLNTFGEMIPINFLRVIGVTIPPLFTLTHYPLEDIILKAMETIEEKEIFLNIKIDVDKYSSLPL